MLILSPIEVIANAMPMLSAMKDLGVRRIFEIIGAFLKLLYVAKNYGNNHARDARF